MAKFIIQYGNNNGVFWKEVEADNLTSAKIKATMIANRHTEEVIMLAIESEEGELLASKNFAGKKAVWESHIEAVEAVEAVEVVETAEKFIKLIDVVDVGLQARIIRETEDAGLTIVSTLDSEGEEILSVECDGESVVLYGQIVAPIHQKLEHGNINQMWTLCSREAMKALIALEVGKINPNTRFITCDCGTLVYVTISEAFRLGQAVKYEFEAPTYAAQQGITLSYSGVQNQQCEPCLTAPNGATVDICSSLTVEVLNHADHFYTNCVIDFAASANRYMISYKAANIVAMNKAGIFTKDIIGFVQTASGHHVVVTAEEAKRLGDSFNEIEMIA